MSTSDATEFDDWLAALYESTGDFTMLVILTEIREQGVTPLCSTYFHVVGEDADWDSMSLMFAGSGQQWDGAAFFPTKSPQGGPIDNPTARLRLNELEENVTKDRMVLNEGNFFDALGRKIKVEPILDS